MAVAAKRTFAGWLLIVLQALLGVGAVAGGSFLVIDPSGGMMGMPSDMMKVTLFPDYLIPGIILLLGLGVFPLIIMVALVKKWDWKWGEKLNVFKHLHWSWTFSLYIGFMLIIWITVQAYILEVMAIIHVVYIALGLAIQVVTLLPSVSSYYMRATSDSNRGGERIAS
jgi:hypothetical protein